MSHLAPHRAEMDGDFQSVIGRGLLTFLLVAAAKSCLFLAVSTWSFLPLFITD